MRLIEMWDGYPEEDADAFSRILQSKLENIGEVLLFRGIDENGSLAGSIDHYKKITVPKRRKPRDTDQDINNFIDRVRASDYKEGIPSRKGQMVFATTDSYNAEEYGTVYIVFIPKEYVAIYGENDPTFVFFNSIAVSMQSIENSSDQLYMDYFPKPMANAYYKLLGGYPDDLKACYKAIEILKKMFDHMNRLKSPDEDAGFNIMMIEDMIDSYEIVIENTKAYFDQLYVAEAPWRKGYYEVMIQCPYYYIVDREWFAKYFEFDKKLNKYVRVKK